MTLIDRLIDQLAKRGLRVEPGPQPGQLVLRGPDAEKTPEVLEAVRAFKPQLLARVGAAGGYAYGMIRLLPPALSAGTEPRRTRRQRQW